MQGLLGWFGWFLWIVTFLFPFGIYVLARLSGATPLLWPLILFYAFAIVVATLAFLVARMVFTRTALSHQTRKTILKLVFLIPLLPGLAYLLKLSLGLFSAGA